LTEQAKTQSTAKPRRRKRKRIIGFCGQILPGKDPRETGELDLAWGGIVVEVPLARLKSFTPLYRYVCAEWIVEAEKGEQPLYPVRRHEEEDLDPEIEKLLKENCVTVGGEEKEWLCLEAFFDKLYPKLKEYFGATS